MSDQNPAEQTRPRRPVTYPTTTTPAIEDAPVAAARAGEGATPQPVAQQYQQRSGQQPQQPPAQQYQQRSGQQPQQLPAQQYQQRSGQQPQQPPAQQYQLSGQQPPAQRYQQPQPQPQPQPHHQQPPAQQVQYQQSQYQQPGAEPARYGYGYHQPAAVQVAAPSAQMAPPGTLPWGVTVKRPVALEIVLVILGGLLASAFLVLTAFVAGGAAVGVAIVLAMVPLVMLVAVIMWIDRWEPEPRFLLVAALLWGAGVAVAVASLLNSVVGPTIAGVVSPDMDPDTAAAVFGAPFVEEGMKGLGILLIFLVRRREFNGPVDGVVYAAVVATGFAIVEDVQYFAGSGESLGFVFVLRALLSPFAHLIYSVPMGLALGMASRMRSRYAWVWLYPIGYAIGVAMHMTWNAGASYATSLASILLLFALVNWIPLAALTGLVIWLRRRESQVVAMRLRDYVPSGWINDVEVANLSSMRANLAARRWAKPLGPQASRAMRDYQRAATSLAYARQDLYTGHSGNRARADELVMLDRLGRARAQVMAATTPRPAW